jgi:hypothetical protein
MRFKGDHDPVAGRTSHAGTVSDRSHGAMSAE